MKIFKEHPKTVGESYWQHLIFAGGLGLAMLFAAIACIIHAIFPFLFANTATTLFGRLERSMELRAMELKEAREREERDEHTDVENSPPG